MEDVKQKRTQEVPDHLKDSSYFGSAKLGHGKDYKYAHSYEGHYVEQEYMPEKRRYYIPTKMGFEKKIGEWMSSLKSMREKDI